MLFEEEFLNLWFEGRMNRAKEQTWGWRRQNLRAKGNKPHNNGNTNKNNNNKDQEMAKRNQEEKEYESIEGFREWRCKVTTDEIKVISFPIYT